MDKVTGVKTWECHQEIYCYSCIQISVPSLSSDPITALCHDLQGSLRVARPPGEGRGRNQLLPRYWPRITDQELKQINSGEYPFLRPWVLSMNSYDQDYIISSMSRVWGYVALDKAFQYANRHHSVVRENAKCQWCWPDWSIGAPKSMRWGMRELNVPEEREGRAMHYCCCQILWCSWKETKF